MKIQKTQKTYIVVTTLVEPRSWVLASLCHIGNDPVSAERARDEEEEQGRVDDASGGC